MIEFNGWMSFPFLDDGAELAGAFTLAYKITDDGCEMWSERFIRFKDKKSKAIWGAAHLLYGSFPDLAKGLQLDPSQTVVTAALSSGETVADPNRAIPQIAGHLAKHFGATCDLTSLSKKAHRRIHDLSGAPARNEELDKAEYRAKPIKAQNVVVLDDFITRGGTLSRIARAIRASSGDVRVYGVALGKTERRSWVPTLSNEHVPEKWSTLWLEGEKAFQDRA